ncbi:MAG: hypothetical protein ACT4OX_15660 [Actinomycetota bacterium]
MCEEYARAVLEYLRTGETRGHPELEQAYATRRAEILKEPSEVRDELERATASDYVERCDAQYSAAEAEQEREQAEEEAQREAQRQRGEEEAEAERAETERVARFDSECTSRGGSVNESHDYCSIEHPAGGELPVPLLHDGTFDEGEAALERENCELAMQDAQNAASDGHPWSQLPEYYEEVGACFRGSP